MTIKIKLLEKKTFPTAMSIKFNIGDFQNPHCGFHNLILLKAFFMRKITENCFFESNFVSIEL